MDLALHLRVIWRFRFFVAGGLVLAICLTVLSMARVEFRNGVPTLTYRQSETWAGQAKVLITQKGLPWGRSVLPAAPTTGTPSTSQQVFADPQRLTSLASFYAQLGNSDVVQRSLPQKAVKLGEIKAAPVVDTTPDQNALPIVGFTAQDTSPARANKLAADAATSLMKYVREQQKAAGIPVAQRVDLQMLNRPLTAQLLQGRKKTLPIVVFATVLMATLGLAFILQNLRPDDSAVAEPTGDEVGSDARDDRFAAVRVKRRA